MAKNTLDDFDNLLKDLENLSTTPGPTNPTVVKPNPVPTPQKIEVTNTTTTTYSLSTPQQEELPKATASTYRQPSIPPSTVSTTVSSTVAKPVNPNIIVTGRGIQNGVVGYPNEFRVSLSDGSKINPGDLLINFSGPSQVEASVTQIEKDTVAVVRYTVKIAGKYTVDIAVRGQRAPNCPYQIYIQPTVTLNYELKGIVHGKVGEQIQIAIDVRDDETKQPYLIDSSAFDVKISGPESVSYNIKDNKDGTFVLSYTPRLPGDYAISVAVFGEYIFGHSFTSSITYPADPTRSVLQLETKNAVTGQKVQCKLNAVDRDGRVRMSGGDDFNAEVSGPEPKDSLIVDKGDGTYSIEFMPLKPGKYQVFVTLNGVNVMNSPLEVHVN
jgi:hypothetical protein